MQGLWCGCNSSWHLLAQPDMECDMLTIGSWLRLTPPSKPLPLILWLWRKLCVVVFGDSWTAVFQLVHTLTHSPHVRGPHVRLPLLGQNLLTAHKGGVVKRGGRGAFICVLAPGCKPLQFLLCHCAPERPRCGLVIV